MSRGPGRAPVGHPPVGGQVDLPALVEHPADGGGHVVGLAGAQLGRTGLVVVGVAPEHADRRPDRRVGPDAVEGLVRRLRRQPAPLGGLDEQAEHVVDRVDQRPAGAVVGGERHAVAAGAEPLGGPQEQRDVGPAEPVDRLLGVADEEQPAGLGRRPRPTGVGAGVGRGGDEDGQLDLDGVGVLELVDEEAPVAVVDGGPHGRAVGGVAQHLAGHDQQVVELELARHPALGGGVEGELAQLDGQPPAGRRAPRRCARRRTGRPARRARRGGRRGRRPRASCPCGPCRRPWPRAARRRR